MSLFATKPIDRIIKEADAEGIITLKRTLGPWSLVALGIGAIIGAGIFVRTGTAAAEYAGPAVVISFMISGLGCLFAGMCYSELASMIPVSGSAYTYSYAVLGELPAWIIGWDLVLEYAVASAVVASGWSHYVDQLVTDLHSMGLLSFSIPVSLIHSPFDTTPGILNFFAMLVIVFVSLLLIIGIQESSRFNVTMVVLKLAIVLAVIFFGFHYIDFKNYHPFIPPNQGDDHYGWSGIMRAASVVFFAYIGFDAVSTAAQEARNPSRDMFFGIVGSLGICTVLYIAVSLVLTGMVNYKDLHDQGAPVAFAFERTNLQWPKLLIDFGVICGLTSVILVLLLGQSRVFYAMSRDGLLPKIFSDLHPRFRTPWKANLLFMVVVALLTGSFSIDALGDMTSIGTLFAFIIVCASVIVLRRTNPSAPRPYRTPFVPLFPILGILICGYMMYFIPPLAWARLVGWLAIGLVVYFTYSRQRSKLQHPKAAR
jgi:APA family basic amino acid/polyamine antiporter